MTSTDPPPEPGEAPAPRSYEPAPAVGKLLLFLGVFLVFAVIVVAGGVYLTAG
ncbi:hypothetical protein AB0J21_00355 [Streptomyces sp. NPDC049954]|uniref:hypothetical protein n=1 Tax=Streptomyces sp. NPDC049954 TaxID=3155779 RepID=UPI0034204207